MPEEALIKEQPPEETETAEGLATEDGWVPKNEWKGDPADWKTADEFLSYDGTSRKELHKRNEKLYKEMDDLKRLVKSADKKSNEYERNMKALVAMQAQAIQQTREATRQEIIDKQRAAAVDGDVEALDRLEKERDKLDKEKPPPVQQPQQFNIPPDVQEWVNDNPWFVSNKSLGIIAQVEYADMLAARGYTTDANLSSEERLDILNEVRDTVKKRYPDKFGVKNKPKDSGDDGKGPEVFSGPGKVRSTPTTGDVKSFSSLPKEAKAMYDEFVANGVYKKDDKAGKEKYAKAFFEHKSSDMEE